jgi:hypothetical protein
VARKFLTLSLGRLRTLALIANAGTKGITTAAISSEAKLSMPRVTDLVKGFVQAGLVRDKNAGLKEPGRRYVRMLELADDSGPTLCSILSVRLSVLAKEITDIVSPGVLGKVGVWEWPGPAMEMRSGKSNTAEGELIDIEWGLVHVEALKEVARHGDAGVTASAIQGATDKEDYWMFNSGHWLFIAEKVGLVEPVRRDEVETPSGDDSLLVTRYRITQLGTRQLSAALQELRITLKYLALIVLTTNWPIRFLGSKASWLKLLPRRVFHHCRMALDSSIDAI